MNRGFSADQGRSCAKRRVVWKADSRSREFRFSIRTLYHSLVRDEIDMYSDVELLQREPLN